MVRNILFLLTLIVFCSCQKSTDTPEVNEPTIEKGKINKTITINGTTREYIVYIPQRYNGTKKAPLLLAFHGLGGNMESSFNNTQFDKIAEKENFISVYPNGISSRWNVLTTENNVDLEFISTLISEMKKDYTIDAKRIYSTGMSNGGYLSFLLACELSEQIAAIGSVTGLMFRKVYNTCNPTRPIPIMQIHGTADNVVNYENVEPVIYFWSNHNNTDKDAIRSKILDTDKSDGSTVERFTYKNGDKGVEVQHLKITGGGHDWPGHKGNMDIDASEEVWNFLKRYDINGKI